MAELATHTRALRLFKKRQKMVVVVGSVASGRLDGGNLEKKEKKYGKKFKDED